MTDANEGLRVSVDDGVVVVEGELDAHTASLVAPRLDPLPDGDGDVVVDLAGIEFIDSSGLRLLVGAHQAAEQVGRRVVLRHPSTAVERLLEIAGLTGHLHVEGSGD